MKNQKKKQGLTLIELIVTIAILSLILAPLGNMVLQSVKVTKSADDIQKATNLGQQYMEKIKASKSEEIVLSNNPLSDLSIIGIPNEPVDKNTDNTNLKIYYTLKEGNKASRGLEVYDYVILVKPSTEDVNSSQLVITNSQNQILKEEVVNSKEFSLAVSFHSRKLYYKAFFDKKELNNKELEENFIQAFEENIIDSNKQNIKIKVTIEEGIILNAYAINNDNSTTLDFYYDSNEFGDVQNGVLDPGVNTGSSKFIGWSGLVNRYIVDFNGTTPANYEGNMYNIEIWVKKYNPSTGQDENVIEPIKGYKMF